MQEDIGEEEPSLAGRGPPHRERLPPTQLREGREERVIHVHDYFG